MTRRTMIDLTAQMEALLADNADNQISAANVRTTLGDFIDTMTPAYSFIQLAVPAPFLLTTTPIPFDIWDTILFDTPNEYTAELAVGSVKIVDPSVSRFTMLLDFEANQNDQLKAQIYVNGNPTAYSSQVIAEGANDSAQLTLNGLLSTEVIGDKIQIFLSATAGSFTPSFIQGTFIVEYVQRIGL
jgi:hypothetical protein